LCKAKLKLILAEEDNIQHILASLALKVTRQSVIIAKLNSYSRKNRTKKALWELDNLRALKRGESYHKLVRAVAYANGGKLRVRTDQEQCLHPIGIARARRAPAGLPTGRRGRVLPPACVCG
jgi:TnpA family transposase